MKKLLLISAAFAALITGPAIAADQAVRVYRRPVVVAAPVYSWSGFYVGVNAGDAWGHRDFAFTPNDFLIPTFVAAFGGIPPQPISIGSNRGVFGGQIGYNWQFARRWVAGLETDINSRALDGSGSSQFFFGGASIFPILVTFNNVMTSDVEHFGTVRGRLGYLLSDNLLLYGTGGLAYGRVNTTSQVFPSTPRTGSASFAFSFNCVSVAVPCWSGASSRNATGWTAGTGLEWAFLQNFTLRAEYLYVNLGNDSFNVVAVPDPGTPGSAPASFRAASNDVTFQVVRFSLNYKFGNYYAPVVTK